MKRKNLFILIAICVAILVFILLYFLLTTKKGLDEKHIQLKFVVHNCGSVVSKKSELRPEFIKPLLEQFTLKQANSSLERNYFASLSCRNGRAFCIPAQGINAIRYNSDDSTASFYSSSARAKDEESFFSSWDGGDIFEKLEKALMDGNKLIKNPSLDSIKKQDPKKFIDSFIIDRNYKGNSPFIYKSAMELRSFVNKQIMLFPNGTKTIHIFIYCGSTENKPVVLKEFLEDPDNDKILGEQDKCPLVKGEKKCDGCPCPPPPLDCTVGDEDNDGICDDKDKCPTEFGFKKYRGCPIPDSDGDGFNDEVDECPDKPALNSQDGCPLKFKIKHNNGDGTFTVEGISDLSKYKVYMRIKQPINGPSKGAVVVHDFQSIVCPSEKESKKIINLLRDPSDLTVTIVIEDLNGQSLFSQEFKHLDMICFSKDSCGFVNLDNIQ